MQKKQLAFKETQFFDWNTEPKEERPSEFHTTGFSTASGYYHSLGDAAVPRRSRSKGHTTWIIGLLAVIAVGMVAVYSLAHWLRA
jgi:hypothetical protein